MAKENENPIEILSTIKQIVNNCSLDKSFDVNKIALFDLEYLFLKLRAVSVENTITVTYKDNEDGKTYEFEINLDEVNVVFPEKIQNNIKITEKSGMIMKYPSASLYDDESFLSMQKEQLFALIVRCIDSIYFEDEIYNASDYKVKELEEFLEGLDIKTFEKVQSFLISLPKLEKKLEYTNSLGNKREIVLNTLSDFFTWR